MASRYAGPKIVNGRLTQVGECFWQMVGNRKRRAAVFLCECGTSSVIDHRAVASGKTGSCGCRKKDSDVSNRLKHGCSSKGGKVKRTRAYSIWTKMTQRCNNPNNPKFPIYGGRGILICTRWLEFENFLEDMGEPEPGLSIDRIDTNGPYEKGNCRWATAKEQANNTRTNVIVELDGERMTLKQAAEKAGVKYKLLWKYVQKRKLSLSDAIARCKRIA